MSLHSFRRWTSGRARKARKQATCRKHTWIQCLRDGGDLRSRSPPRRKEPPGGYPSRTSLARLFLHVVDLFGELVQPTPRIFTRLKGVREGLGENRHCSEGGVMRAGCLAEELKPTTVGFATICKRDFRQCVLEPRQLPMRLLTPAQPDLLQASDYRGRHGCDATVGIHVLGDTDA